METPEERAKRIFEEDEKIQELRRQEEDTRGLKERHQKRLKCYEENKLFIQMIYLGGRYENRKGKRYRGHLQKLLCYISNNEFNNEDEEYDFVKLLRYGIDEGKIARSFNKGDRKKILEIFEEYGVFDY